MRGRHLTPYEWHRPEFPEPCSQSHPNLLASPSREQLLSGSAMKALERKHVLQSDMNSSPALPLNWLCNPGHTPYFSGPQAPPWGFIWLCLEDAMRGCGNRLSMVFGAQQACNKGRLLFPSALPVASAAEPRWPLISPPPSQNADWSFSFEVLLETRKLCKN